MAKSRTFSCYLLKETSNPENSLKEGHSLTRVQEESNHLPEGAILFIANNAEKSPWWREYWGISKTLKQQQAAALIFLPIKNRWITLTFGYIYHQLKDTSFVYDFGLRTTLNVLDPEKIKSTDILQPENAKRQKIQTPIASTLNYFDIAHDESIIKKLTGLVKREYKNLFSNITGADSLRISSKCSPEEIISLCQELYDIYTKEDFKKKFPNINNITPIKDPSVISLLNEKLLVDFNEGSMKLTLAIPEIYDDSKSFRIRYRGAGLSHSSCEDVFIRDYRNYLKDRGNENAKGSIDDFHKHKMQLINENNQVIKEYSIYKTFLYDCELENSSYHLCDGAWYLIDKDYIQKLSNKINKYFSDEKYDLLPPNKFPREDDYNNYVSKHNDGIICLDKKNISPKKQYPVEPCDLITIYERRIHLIHVKVSTRSSSLSHLFNQGLNSVELLRMEEESQNKLKCLLEDIIDEKKANISLDNYKDLINKKEYVVVYGIVTKKANSNLDDLSRNLPIFSRITLYRTIKSLESRNIKCLVCLVDNQFIKK